MLGRKYLVNGCRNTNVPRNKKNTMKILLDECVTKRLKKYLQEFEVFTVRELELSGVKMASC